MGASKKRKSSLFMLGFLFTSFTIVDNRLFLLKLVTFPGNNSGTALPILDLNFALERYFVGLSVKYQISVNKKCSDKNDYLKNVFLKNYSIGGKRVNLAPYTARPFGQA